MKDFEKALRLNLQFFAEEDPKENDDPSENPTDEDPENNPAEEDEKKFSQKELDELIQKRLDRERKKQEKQKEEAEAEAERKRLEEQEEYKDLAEKYKEQLDEFKADALNAKKDSMLAKAGYNDEQIERYRKYLEGESDEELSAALDQLKEDIPPKKNYVDPNAGNGNKDKPNPKDPHEEGKTLYQRLKASGKIKGSQK